MVTAKGILFPRDNCFKYYIYFISFSDLKDVFPDVSILFYFIFIALNKNFDVIYIPIFLNYWVT